MVLMKVTLEQIELPTFKVVEAQLGNAMCWEQKGEILGGLSLLTKVTSVSKAARGPR